MPDHPSTAETGMLDIPAGQKPHVGHSCAAPNNPPSMPVNEGQAANRIQSDMKRPDCHETPFRIPPIRSMIIRRDSEGGLA